MRHDEIDTANADDLHVLFFVFFIKTKLNKLGKLCLKFDFVFWFVKHHFSTLKAGGYIISNGVIIITVTTTFLGAVTHEFKE